MPRLKKWVPVLVALALVTPLVWVAGRWAAFRAMGGPLPIERGPFTVQGVSCGMKAAEARRGPADVEVADGRVVGVRGRVLESSRRPVLRAGDTLGKVRQVLGPPDEELDRGTVNRRGTWRYVGPELEVEYSGDVVERVALGRHTGSQR